MFAAKVSLTTGFAALATSVVVLMLVLRALRKNADGESLGPSTGTIWVSAVVAVSLILAAVLKNFLKMSMDGVLDDIWDASAYYDKRAYKMEI